MDKEKTTDAKKEISNEPENDKLKECEKICNEYLSGWQRAKADFANYKKEESKRIGELADFLKVQWVFELLKIADNFGRALKHKPQEGESSLEEWAKGIEMIDSQIKDFFKSQGVEEVKALGEKFNPEFHEAIGETNDSTQEAEIISEVLEKGYTLNGKLIRPSKVKVSK